jgi:hypothetical protein
MSRYLVQYLSSSGAEVRSRVSKAAGSRRCAAITTSLARGISKFNPVSVSLTSYDPEFVRLSKFDLAHAKFFDLGSFDVFP